MKYVKAIYIQFTKADVDRLAELTDFFKDHPTKTIHASDSRFLLALLECDPDYLKFWRELERRGKIPKAG